MTRFAQMLGPGPVSNGVGRGWPEDSGMSPLPFGDTVVGKRSSGDSPGEES